MITLNGQALPDASVMFQPEEGRSSIGKTNSAGQFTLRYSESSEGATVGQHLVQVTTVPPDEAANERVPSQYNTKSILTAEVKPGKNEFKFELTTR